MKDILVVDIDGTIADGDHRVHHLQGEKKDWATYFSLLHLDTPRQDVIDNIRLESIDSQAHIILVSARPETYRQQTVEWLREHKIPYLHLLMRGENDRRDDDIVKKAIYNKYLKHYNILRVFDDRPRVIRMWRELGLEVEDVGKGIEF